MTFSELRTGECGDKVQQLLAICTLLATPNDEVCTKYEHLYLISNPKWSKFVPYWQPFLEPYRRTPLYKNCAVKLCVNRLSGLKVQNTDQLLILKIDKIFIYFLSNKYLLLTSSFVGCFLRMLSLLTEILAEINS